MKRVILLLLFFSLTQLINAQYTEIINSKRPGFSESPYSIGTNVFQFETGLFYKTSNNETILSRPNTIGGELFFRYGKFREKLEFNAKVTYQRDEILNNPPEANSFIRGISELTIGAKYLIYEQKYTDKSKEIRSWKRRVAFDKKRFIPSVGAYVGVNTNFLGDGFKENELSIEGAVLLQNDFSDRLVLLTNLIADKILSDSNEYSYIATMTYALNYKWSYFIENQGIFEKGFAPKFHFGTGVAYLFSNNLQLDASVRTNFFDDYSFLYSSIGAAWRIDRHSDGIVPKTQLTKQKSRKKGNIFSRLFKKKN
ncbi:MAG: transporter [Lutibacter sp.]|nr:transporter [Lutibacter sp.]